ncbi:MAG: monooxygenase [Glaciihabitans sp.]|nr:monooxygenase [Glaciihabitans sp.]
MPQAISTDVVIVGAGPTGLMLASCLSKLGVGAVIVDGKSGPTRESRALVLQARTMEIYDQLGLVDRVLAQAEIASSIVPGFGKKSFAPVNLRRLATGVTPYPHLYVLEQSKNERLLVDHLREQGRDVRWNCELESIEEVAGNGVRVACRTSDGEALTITARYCVGADGSSSAVRRLTGVEFEGKTNEHTFYVLDATGVRGLQHGSINLRFGERDFLLTFPMDSTDHERLLGVVRTTDRTKVDEAVARDTLARAFGITYGTSVWFSTYRVHHRVARQFRSGPVFLAGDAAHVHSPVGAQGMNTGLQDAHNLAAKIADVVFGRAADAYLDRYEAERRPVARRLVSTTDTMFGVVTSDRLLARMIRRSFIPVFAPLAASIAPRLPGPSRIFEYLSQTRIHYWMSDEARQNARGRRGSVVGRRLPWNGDNFDSLRSMAWQVHAYGDVPAESVRELQLALALPILTFATTRNRKLASGMLYLVRPDGFVAAAATPDDAPATFAGALADPLRAG